MHSATKRSLFLLILCLGAGNLLLALDKPYLGQVPPGDTPQLFGPGIIHVGMATRDIAITPDGKEIYFCVILGRNKTSHICFSKLEQGKWTSPQVVAGLDRPGEQYIEPHISPDGQRFFFASDRPVAGKDAKNPDFDIWVMERKGNGWGEPRNLGGPINTNDSEFFPSVTKDNTLYFTAADPQTKQEAIFRSRFKDGAYQQPEKLPAAVNAGVARFNAWVAPDESYLIVPIFKGPQSLGGTDYYVSFRNPDDTWVGPIHLGALVNSAEMDEYSACVSPDGRYFFFMTPNFPKVSEMPKTITWDYLQKLSRSGQNGNSAIFWVDAAFIQKLKPATPTK